jgi:two-component system, chemotaxis family, sensor kinase CheA
MQNTVPLKPSRWMGKYRSIILAIGLFIVLDLLVLMATFFAAYQIAEDTAAVNLVNRQRMLSQRIAKTIHVAEADQTVSQPSTGPLKELKGATALFDATHRGFRVGGAVEDNAGQEIRVKPLEDAAQQDLLKQISALWTPYVALIDALTGSSAPATETIRKAADYSRANSTKILDLLTQLGMQFEAGLKEKTNVLRVVQIVGILLALANLAYIVFVLVRKLRAGDDLIDQQHREHAQIMANVREGLFLLNKDGTIGSQMSASFPEVMGQPASPGMDFLSILKNLVPEKDHDAATEYVDLLFGDRVKESLVASLNPLSQLELRGPDETGEMTSRFISLQFSRVKAGREITHLLVTAQDVSDRVRLTQAVKDAEARAQEEIKGLLDLLELEPAVSKRFLIDTEQSLDAINDALRGAGQTRDYPSTISEIFRRVHKLKGEATVHNLTLFETLAHRFETMLSELRDRPNLNGDDLLAIPPHLEDIYSRTAKLRSLAERMSSKDAHLVQSAASGHEFGYMLEALAEKVSANQKKKVRVLADVPDYGTLPESKAAMLRDIAIQLVRNAVVHGIEDANERVMSSKTETGSIHVTLKRLDADKFEFAVRDDGRGVIPEHIRESLVKSGRYSRAEADALDERALVMKLFEPGISTSATVDNDSGRGVGLDVVAEKVKAMGAQIRLGTRPNLFTQFNIIFAAAA